MWTPRRCNRCRSRAGNGATFKTVRVHSDHHVEIDGHRYRVPQALVCQARRFTPRAWKTFLDRSTLTHGICMVDAPSGERGR